MTFPRRIGEAEAEVVRKSSRLYQTVTASRTLRRYSREGVIRPRSHTSFSKPHGWVGSSVRQLILRRLLWEIRYGAQEEARTVGRQEVPAPHPAFSCLNIHFHFTLQHIVNTAI